MNDTDNDNLHYTALELAEIKSEQVLATDANKKAETEATAEQTIVFVASDNSEDRAHERVEIATFENGKLVFTVGISKREYAQDLMTLIDEGHLHDAFSIGWRSGTYAPDTKTYTDGEILEVSLVTRGCNRDAFVLDIKSDNQSNRDAPPNPPNENNEPTTNKALSNQGEKTMQDEDIKNTETTAPTPEAPSSESESAPETNQEQPQTKGASMNETTNHKQIAASQVQAPTQKMTVTSNAKAYLDTEEANVDFAKFIAENYGKSNSAVIKAWAEKMAEKGLTGDAILPTTIEQTFFKVWTSDRGILAHMKSAKALQGSVYGFYAKGRGAGHKKGHNYSIDGVSIGKNYETGEVEHLTFNCSLAIYSDERPKFCLERDRNVFLVTETGRMFMLEQFVST